MWSKHLDKPFVICVFLASGFKLVSPYFPKLAKWPHVQQELLLEDFAFFIEKSSVALYLTHFRYLWHHGCDSGTYLQSPLAKPQAEPKAYLLPKDSRRCCFICVSLETNTMHHFLPHNSNTHWGLPLAPWFSMECLCQDWASSQSSEKCRLLLCECIVFICVSRY